MSRPVFFFFQAEDGIRDHCVTGVQTCALPIWLVLTTSRDGVTWSDPRRIPTGGRGSTVTHLLPGVSVRGAGRRAHVEIGRASCRERVEITVVAVAPKRKRERSTSRTVQRAIIP